MALKYARIVTLGEATLETLAALLEITDDQRVKEIVLKNDDGAETNGNEDLIRVAGETESAAVLAEEPTMTLADLPGIRINESLSISAGLKGDEIPLNKVWVGSVTDAQSLMVWIYD